MTLGLALVRAPRGSGRCARPGERAVGAASGSESASSALRRSLDGHVELAARHDRRRRRSRSGGSPRRCRWRHRRRVRRWRSRSGSCRARARVPAPLTRPSGSAGPSSHSRTSQLVARLDVPCRPRRVDRVGEPVRRGVERRPRSSARVAADRAAPCSTSPATRSGASSAASSATPPPIELPDQPGAARSATRRRSPRAGRRRAGTAGRPGATSPNPRRSYATTSHPAACSRSAHLAPAAPVAHAGVQQRRRRRRRPIQRSPTQLSRRRRGSPRRSTITATLLPLRSATRLSV